MRPPVDDQRIRALARELGRVARAPTRIYLTGGSTAVLEDLADVRTMIERGLMEPTRLRALYEEIEPELYKYPAIDPSALTQKLDAALA